MTSEFRLTEEQVTQFKELGLLGPFKLCEPEQMAGIKQVITREMSGRSQSPLLAGLPYNNDRHRHLDLRFMYDLCTMPAIIEPIKQLLGPQLMLFKTQFFDKKPFGPSIPWHQESPNWGMEGVEVVSAWIAFDDAPAESGCMLVIPRTHDRVYERELLPAGEQHTWPTFHDYTPVESWDPDRIVPCSMRAGEFVFFADLVHGSNANTTPNQRMGFTARYTRAEVTLKHDKFYPGHAAVMVSGTETNPRNHMVSPPSPGMNPRLQSLLDGTELTAH